MSLLLKSNSALKLNKLTDRVATGITATLDFRDMKFTLAGSNVSYTDILTVTRATGGGSYNAAGDYSNIGAGTGRISFDLTRNKKGLLVEQIQINEFYNSYAPASHSRNLSISANSGMRVLTCVGAGSVELLIDNVSKGVATESKPLFYLPLSASTQIQFIVNGRLSYAGFMQL